MADVTNQPASGVENVGRGTLFALLAIPVAVAAFVIISGIFGLITGIVAIAIPYVSNWLYTKGAGAPLSRAGWAGYIGVTAAAIVLGVFAGIAASAWYVFSSVGGDGGILSSAFWTTVRYQFTTGLSDNITPILFGLGLGIVGIVSVVRGRAFGNRAAANRLTPAQTDAVTDAAAPAAPPAPPVPPAANQPSSGVMLNGKPVDPDKK